VDDSPPLLRLGWRVMSAQQIATLIDAHIHGLAPAAPVGESLEVRLYAMKVQRQANFAAALGLRGV
jgi:hypothetical protein